MRTRLALVIGLTILISVMATAPAASDPNNAADTFLLVMDVPNVGVAPNGDRVEITCEARQHECGTFPVHPKALPDPPSGEFVHTRADGTVVGGGTWTATDLLAFEFYGCRFIPALGVDLGDDDLCGGAVKLRVVLTTAIGSFDGVLTVFCIVGPQAPPPHSTPEGEGVTLSVNQTGPALGRGTNFNRTGGGENIYIRL